MSCDFGLDKPFRGFELGDSISHYLVDEIDREGWQSVGIVERVVLLGAVLDPGIRDPFLQEAKYADFFIGLAIVGDSSTIARLISL